jgi:glycosyltransferase involved in cell wall biosynthesis
LKTSPLVSVGIATYNRPAQLVKCLQSIKNQNYKNLEIIISDDCSSDKNVYRIAKKFKKNNKQVKIFRQKINLGAAKNLEFVLQKSTGKYFFWADDEDGINSKFVSKIVNFLEKNPHVVLCSSEILVKKSRFESKKILLNKLRQKNWYSIKPLFFQYPISEVFYAILGVYRTNKLKQAGTHYLTTYKNYHINDEVPFLAHLSNFGEIRAIDQLLKTYILNNKSNYHSQMKAIKTHEWILLRFYIRLKLLKIALRSPHNVSFKTRLIMEIIYSMFFGYFKLLGHRFEKTIRRLKNSAKKRIFTKQ